MSDKTYDRLYGFRNAFDHDVTLVVTLALAAVLLAVPCIFWLLARLGKIDERARGELWRRYLSWLVLIPVLLIPILLGAAWTIIGIGALSIFCYREYARAVGLFREKTLSLLIVVGITLITFAVFDHWYNFFMALTPLAIASLVAVAILADEPKGYIQRVALSVLGFCLFGTCMGHLGYIANDENYRPMIILLLLSVEANDIFAFMAGKTLGRRKLCPNTSPNKTIAGALGALVLTTLLVSAVGWFVFAGTPLQSWPLLAVLGALISLSGQLGDLALSSIKRDLGLKDMGVLIPGHGGLLDRFDSVLLAAPVFFHYVGYFVGFGLEQAPRIVSGG
ncbi:MAG: phosphatidate cytidylyltransferase [Gemmataceae bacterium]|nr:phosphatidate cytidylyltransferase [Gemmataceae bacterium]